jgi:NADH-quinone oxidoreductase subunit B
MKMVPVLQRIWLQMPEPKWCISMGACASSGGVFDTYCTVQGIDRFIPVDVYVPGCPPRPEQLIRSVLDIQEKVQRTGTIDAREFESRTAYEGPAPLVKELPPQELVIAPGNFKTAGRVRGLPVV